MTRRHIAYRVGAHGDRLIPSEHQSQVALMDWCALSLSRYPELRWLFAIPNGGIRFKGTAVGLKAEGVKKGVPDLCLPVARRGFHGAFIEMKREGAYPTVEQKVWAEALMAQGYDYTIAHSFEAARDFLIAYLSVKP